MDVQEKFEKTNPRATLLEGYLYYRHEDVISFLHALLAEIEKAAVGMKRDMYDDYTSPQDPAIAHEDGYNEALDDILALLRPSEPKREEKT